MRLQTQVGIKIVTMLCKSASKTTALCGILPCLSALLAAGANARRMPLINAALYSHLNNVTDEK